MSFDRRQLTDMIIIVLNYLSPTIPVKVEAIELLLLTAAVESDFGTYVRQIPSGPALGIFQVETTTELDLWRWISGKPKLLNLMLPLIGDPILSLEGLTPSIYNIAYQIALARLFYWRIPESLPKVRYISSGLTDESVNALAKYYKKYFNTELGKSSVEKAANAYRKYVG